MGIMAVLLPLPTQAVRQLKPEDTALEDNHQTRKEAFFKGVRSMVNLSTVNLNMVWRLRLLLYNMVDIMLDPKLVQLRLMVV